MSAAVLLKPTYWTSRHAKAVLCVIAGLVALGLLWRGLTNEVGAHFDRESDFFRAQNTAGWQEMGRYSHPLAFPATVASVQSARDGIQFRTPDGVPHSYSGFAGKEFKLYTFRPVNAEKAAFVLLMTRR
jgi:hypothetical protein